MKIAKLLVVFLIIILIVQSICLPTHAVCETYDVVYFSDGSYMVINLLVQDARSGNIKTASKVYTYYNVANTAQWAATLTASFEFDGTEYWTTSATMDISISNSSWYVISKSVTYSGCGATGEITMGQKILGVKTSEKSATLTLSCSPHGTIS